MGPLSVKAQVQQQAGHLKNQMSIIKTMNDEGRKETLHKLKVAKEVAKAKAEGLTIDPKIVTDSPAKGHGVGAAPLSNPEAGPTDTVPTMLTPGEAVIPATVAQDPRFKPIIARLVSEGRNRNESQGFKDGTPSVKPQPEPNPKERSIWEIITGTSTGNEGGVGKAKKALSGRQKQLEEAERKAVQGYSDGTTSVKKPEPKERSIWEIITGTATGNEGGVGKAKKAISGRQKQLEEAERKAVQGYFGGTTSVISEEELAALLESTKGKSSADLTTKQRAAIEAATSGVDRYAAADAAAGIPDAPAGSLPQEDMIKQQMSFARSPLSVTDREREIILSEARKTGDPKIIAQVESEFNPERRVGTERGRATNVSPPIDPNEVATLERFIANPGTGATERGKAQLRLAEIYRSQGQTKMPAIERQYQGVGAPAVPKPKDLVIPTTPSVNELRNTVPPEAIPQAPRAPEGFSLPAAQHPDPGADDRMKLPVDVAVKAEAFDRALEDKDIQTKLSALQKTPPPPDKDPKSWLSEALSGIFSDTGLFSNDDLIRFGILAAGGMLTGGSVGGSLRFAGLAALKSSSDRLNTQRQAQAQMEQQQRAAVLEGQKNIRERNETLEGTYHTKLDKADPKAVMAAQKLFEESRAPGATPYVREAKLQQAIQLLATNQVPTDNGKNRAPVFGRNAQTGKPISYLYDKNDRLMVEDPKTGDFVDAKKAGVNIMSESQFNTQETNTRKSVEDRLTDNLLTMNTRNGKPINKDFTTEKARVKAARMTEELMSIRADFGFDTKPEDFSKIADEAISNLKEEFQGRPIDDISPEALRRIVYGTAVIARRPTNKGMYMVEGADGKSKRPGSEALQHFGNAVRSVMEEGQRAGIDLTTDKIAAKLEAQYKALPDPVREKYEVSARGDLKVKGYSPYLLWVRDQYKNK